MPRATNWFSGTDCNITAMDTDEALRAPLKHGVLQVRCDKTTRILLTMIYQPLWYPDDRFRGERVGSVTGANFDFLAGCLWVRGPERRPLNDYSVTTDSNRLPYNIKSE